MSSFLLVSPRTGDDIVAQEYKDFLQATGLSADELDQVQLDSTEDLVPPIDKYKGVLIGGSPFNITDKLHTPKQIHIMGQLRRLVDCELPTIFICFGAGYVASDLGGAVGRTHPEESGATLVQLTEEGKKDPLFSGFPEGFQALTGHTENITDLNPVCTLLATGPTCPVQIFRYGEHTWACQFHAEMNPDSMEARMRFYIDYGYFHREDFDKIVATLPSVDTTYSNGVLRSFVRYCETRKAPA
ncbi:glutamine amidotransferase [Corynebacterium pyruviciproducens]|uniref:Glutamine amidotransferase n=1 Tax=Corynebacterium pyruviciproducens TaxID=598660 RepID=A0AAF1BTL0_9CORY|nr:glutamine amidotransferase [Corynebacterium pyruviciproducens]WOT03289.1 glutamine amidotransferase [Corynebacterium pyruviciproducens]